ncbi:MAG: DMT family transporter [Clostridiaceae bacterium]|nr:DMT family transporter [Clostridiaceae bacterium]
MYNFLALISGAIIGSMIFLNGELTQYYGMYNATVIFHVVAVVFTLIICKIGKKKIFPREKLPFWFYLGGLFMIFPTLFENFAFGKISMTSIMALSLFGQTFCSLLFDRFGWLGMERHPFRKTSLIGIIFSLTGIGIMLTDLRGTDNPAILAIVLVFLSGTAIVVYRTINARLTEHIGSMPTSFISHFVGLPFILLLAIIMPGASLRRLAAAPSANFRIYLGGVGGAVSVFLMNITVPKISAFNQTLLNFVGKVFVGILLDLILESSFSPITFYGGLIIAAGIFLNIIIEHFQERQKAVV